MPFWSKDFTDNLKTTEILEDIEVPAPAHISQDSDSEHSTKVATKSKKHSIFSHFPKDRNCDVCLRTKITKATCRRSTAEALPRAEKFGDLITADHKVVNEGCESRDNHQYAVVVQDLATQRIQLIRVKQNLHMRRKNVFQNSWTVASTIFLYTDNSMESTEKFLGEQKPHAQTVACSYDMEGHAQKCVERYCEVANKKVEGL